MSGERQIFVSYARTDLRVVQPFVDELRREGHTVWIDSSMMQVGDDLGAELNEGVKAADVALAFLTPSYLGRGWARTELSGFLAREADGERIIVPVVHDLKRRQLVRHYPLLAGRVWLDASESGAPGKLCSAIRAGSVHREVHGPSGFAARLAMGAATATPLLVLGLARLLGMHTEGRGEVLIILGTLSLSAVIHACWYAWLALAGSARRRYLLGAALAPVSFGLVMLTMWALTSAL